MIIFPKMKNNIIPTLNQGVKKLFQHQNTKRPTTSKVLKTAIDYTKIIIFYSVFGLSFIFYLSFSCTPPPPTPTPTPPLSLLLLSAPSLSHRLLNLSVLSLSIPPLINALPPRASFFFLLLRISNGIEIGDSLGVQWRQRSVCSVGVVIVKIVVGVLGSCVMGSCVAIC